LLEYLDIILIIIRLYFLGLIAIRKIKMNEKDYYYDYDYDYYYDYYYDYDY